MILIDSLGVERKQTRINYFQLVRRQFLTNQNEFSIEEEFQQKMLKPRPHWIFRSWDTTSEVSVSWWKTWNSLCTDTEINHLHDSRWKLTVFCLTHKVIYIGDFYRINRIYILWNAEHPKFTLYIFFCFLGAGKVLLGTQIYRLLFSCSKSYWQGNLKQNGLPFYVLWFSLRVRPWPSHL